MLAFERTLKYHLVSYRITSNIKAAYVRASAVDAEVAVEFSAAATRSRRAPTAEEAVHLVDEHLERAVAILDAVGPRESVRGGQDAVGVDARLAVQAVPHDRRQIEQHRLRTRASPQYG